MTDRATETGSNGAPRGGLAALFAVLAFIACKGTVFLVLLLSAIGISISINPHLQAAAISLFALIALALIFRDFRRHRVRGPLILAGLASAILIGTMYLHYNKTVESLGLLILFAATFWSWRISRKQPLTRSTTSHD
jgi:uncharacterized membrane protein